jgi:hypothetical protein
LRDNSCTLLAGWLCNKNKQTIKHTHHHSNPHTRVGPQPLLSTLLYLLLTSCSLRLRCEPLCSLGDLYHLTFFSHIIFSDNVRDSSSSKYIISMRRVLLSLSTIQMFSTGSMLSLPAASMQYSRFGLVRAGPTDHLLQQGCGRAWGEAEG